MTFLNKHKQSQSGFTLMEIVVATTVFVVASVSLLSLFNNVLKINRRSEALRQAAQGIRDFMEFMVKEVRNGKIEYFVTNDVPNASGLTPCDPPGAPGGNTYGVEDNKLAVLTTDNIQECFYLGYGPGGAGVVNSPVSNGIFSKDTNPVSPTYNPTPAVVVKKYGVNTLYAINPPNMLVDNLSFIVRPRKDPYTSVGGYAKTQPFVTITIKVRVKLSTGEQVPIVYQTSVSSNKYDIPSS